MNFCQLLCDYACKLLSFSKDLVLIQLQLGWNIVLNDSSSPVHIISSMQPVKKETV